MADRSAAISYSRRARRVSLRFRPDFRDSIPPDDCVERRPRSLANDQRDRCGGDHSHQVRRHFGLDMLHGSDDRGGPLHRLGEDLSTQRKT
jgi:hypothetical protein